VGGKLKFLGRLGYWMEHAPLGIHKRHNHVLKLNVEAGAGGPFKPSFGLSGQF
jgi:hypothetical protein